MKGHEITEVLQEWRGSSPGALERLIPLVAEELRVLARSHFRREGSHHTLQPTALISELYLRLLEQHSIRLDNRTEFFAFASRLMRRILVDHYRKHQKAKRGGGAIHVTLDEEVGRVAAKPLDLLALDKALGDLQRLDSRQHRIVELRFFGGLTNIEVAQAMDLSRSTVKREWGTARAWLRHRMEQ